LLDDKEGRRRHRHARSLAARGDPGARRQGCIRKRSPQPARRAAQIEAARKYNRVVQAGSSRGAGRSTIAAIELAHSGKLGKVLMAKAWNTQPRRYRQ
jgi:hypothetical protein